MQLRLPAPIHSPKPPSSFWWRRILAMPARTKPRIALAALLRFCLWRCCCSPGVGRRAIASSDSATMGTTLDVVCSRQP